MGGGCGGGKDGLRPLTRRRVERVVDVIGHPRSEAPVVGAVLKGSGVGMGLGPATGRADSVSSIGP